VAKLFGFVQFEFAGRLPLADGRYLAEGEKTVLVLQSSEAPAASTRRRRRGRGGGADAERPVQVPVTRVTSIRAAAPLKSPEAAARWLDQACQAEDALEALAEEAIAPLNTALHAQAVAADDPRSRRALAPEQAERVLVGYGSGEETADGRFTDGRPLDLRPRASRRRQREEQLRPQERVAAVLRGRERLETCETLLLRARADLDAGREREAALQLRVGVEAMLGELDGAVGDEGHARDLARLREALDAVIAAAAAAVRGDLGAEQRAGIGETLAICERVLRRRRVLRG
jgi:hypothetical protein